MRPKLTKTDDIFSVTDTTFDARNSTKSDKKRNKLQCAD